MKAPRNLNLKPGTVTGFIFLLLGAALLFWSPTNPGRAQDTLPTAEKKEQKSAPDAKPNAVPAPANAETPPRQAAPSAPSGPQALQDPANPPTAPTPAGPENAAGSDEIQLSFQGANIEMVVQWLAKTTGNPVVPDSFEFYWRPPTPTYDPPKAKRLLAEAGFAGGFDAGDEGNPAAVTQ